MALKKGQDKMMNQDKALVEVPVSRSHKQVKKKTDHGLVTREEVEMITTRATAMVTKDKVGMMAVRAAAKMSGQGEMPTFDACP